MHRNLKRKKGGAKGGAADSKDKKAAATGKEAKAGPERTGTLTSQGGKRHGDDAGEHKGIEKSKSGIERPESHMTDRVDSSQEDK